MRDARAIDQLLSPFHLFPSLLALVVLTFFKAFWKVCSGFSFKLSTLLNEMKSARSAMVEKRRGKKSKKAIEEKKGNKKENNFSPRPPFFSFFETPHPHTQRKRREAPCRSSPSSRPPPESSHPSDQ